jgi:hypothetical protein
MQQKKSQGRVLNCLAIQPFISEIRDMTVSLTARIAEREVIGCFVRGRKPRRLAER